MGWDGESGAPAGELGGLREQWNGCRIAVIREREEGEEGAQEVDTPAAAATATSCRQRHG